MPLRIDVGAFVASASQRRTARRNADLTLGVGAPNFTSEKLGLYQRYVEQQHGPPSEVATAESLTEFLYSSPVESMEVEYRDSSAKLIGVGICDLTGEILSSVYFFWDPSEGRRSLGVFAVLSEIALARELGKRWYHLGYWIENSATMHYKGSLSRHALLGPDGRWVERERLGLL
jgi:arginine-tRNA-protein transferase